MKEVEHIEKLKIELSDLHKKICRVNPYENPREYDYLTYKIEILKRDIQIQTLMLPHIQKTLYEPLKMNISFDLGENDKTGEFIIIHKEKAKELLRALEIIKPHIPPHLLSFPTPNSKLIEAKKHNKKLLDRWNVVYEALGGKDE